MMYEMLRLDQHERQMIASATNRAPVWRFIFAGMSASFIGVGVARFIYTPLIPVMIQQRWFSSREVVYLSAANLAGYFVGAFAGRRIAAAMSNVGALRTMEILVTASLMACSLPIAVPWFFTWRLLSGFGGGVIMVLIGATILPCVPKERKNITSGSIFLGLGLGIAASGTLVPFLLQHGLRTTWLASAAICALLTIATWTSWPRPEKLQLSPFGPLSRKEMEEEASGESAGLIYVVFALMAIGLVPTMMFLVDFIARGLGAGLPTGAHLWILYGVGAMLGPPLYGLAAGRLGARNAVQALLLLQAIAIALLASSSNLVTLAAASVVVGSFPPGTVPLILAWLFEVYPDDAARENAFWSRATMAFAAAQATAAYAYSAVLTMTLNYRLLFHVATTSLVLALILTASMPALFKRLRSLHTPGV